MRRKNTNLQAHRALVNFWFNHQKPAAVWAAFDEDGVIITWNKSKRFVSKWIKRYYKPLWIVKIGAPT